MAQATLLALVPQASQALREILDAARGPVEPPIRSEIFGLQRFAQHGRSLGETHRAARALWGAANFFPRLQSNIRALREAYTYIGGQASTGYDISPAAEWLLDNFHLIEAQLKEIHEGLPRSYFRALPVLRDEPLAGLPRIYGVAWAFVAHTDGAFDEELLTQFLGAYQETRELNLSELWALPTTLRVVLIENLRRLAERVATNKAARAVANLCCDALDDYSLNALDELLALMNQRGVGRVFLAQMAQRLQDHRTAAEGRYPLRYHEWLRNALPDLTAVQAQQPADQAADNLSVSNAVTSLRSIGDADWTDIVARTSGLMRLMLTLPVFEAEHTTTRDQTLHDIELLAKRSGQSEMSVAHSLLSLMQTAPASTGAASVASHWLRGAGRPALVRALGLVENSTLRAFLHGSPATRQVVLPIYLGSLLLATLGLVAWLLLHHTNGLAGASGWSLLAGALMMFPASEAVVAVINRLISESARPRHLPRLSLANGIPLEHRVMVVIPGMLTSAASIGDLVHRLELHYLANPERHAQFALLTDWADADAAHAASDTALLAAALQQIRELNARYPMETKDIQDAGATAKVRAAGTVPRFVLLHRCRAFSDTEARWIGWERKRGKLHEFNRLALGHNDTSFISLDEKPVSIPKDVRFVITLDADTRLPNGSVVQLIGTLAHPLNRPRIDQDSGRVTGGYGILQPRITPALPTLKDSTIFQRISTGDAGLDPYAAAISDVYQDLFSEGSYTGKGIYDVRIFEEALKDRIPENSLLSHDLFEGIFTRCGLISDVEFLEDFPYHTEVSFARSHRWTRGDWQLLPWLLGRGGRSISALGYWKIIDNLRRSLLGPASLLLIILAFSFPTEQSFIWLGLVLVSLSVTTLVAVIVEIFNVGTKISWRDQMRFAVTDFLFGVERITFQIILLVRHSWNSIDAITRSLFRIFISHRKMLEWTTAAQSQAAADISVGYFLRSYIGSLILTLLSAGFVLFFNFKGFIEFLPLIVLWLAAPLIAKQISSPPPKPKLIKPLRKKDIQYLRLSGRRIWSFFSTFVTAEDHFLPPDNFQETPTSVLAHRSSPTNFGLYLFNEG